MATLKIKLFVVAGVSSVILKGLRQTMPLRCVKTKLKTMNPCCLKVVSTVSQSCLKHVSKFSQTCLFLRCLISLNTLWKTPWEFYTHFDCNGYLNVREKPCICIAFTFNLIEFWSEAKKSSLSLIRFSAIIYFVTILEDITHTQEKNILKLNSKVENLTEKYRGEISDNKKKQWVSRMLWSNVFFKSHFD